MRIIVRNQAEIANKYIRKVRRKMLDLNEKFGDLIYSEIYVKQVASGPELYRATVVIGVPGPDIVVSAKSRNLPKLWSDLFLKMKTQLSKYASRRQGQ